MRVHIDDRKVVYAFGQLDRSARDLSGRWARVGADIKSDAVSLAPVLSGALAGNIRAGKAKTRATVSVGGARLPYAAVINYGWPGHNIEATHFLNDALEKNREPAADEVYREMQKLIKLAGLA